MRKLTLFVLTSVLVSIFIASCAKNDPLPNPPEPETYDSLLVRTFTLDTTRTAPNDTIKKEWLSYDALGRISEFREYQWYHNSAHEEVEKVEQYEYSDNSIHPTKLYFNQKRRTNGTIISNDDAITFYTWVNGKLMRDSTHYNDIYNVYTYAYEPSYITCKTTILNSNVGSPRHSESRIFNTFSGSLVISTLDSLVYAPPSSLNVENSRNTVVYNNHPNPYYAYTRAFKTEFIDYFAWGGMINSIASPFLFNEIHHHYSYALAVGDPPTIVEWRIHNAFTYRADGYPLINRETLVHPAGNRYRKTFFFYE